MRLGLAGMIAAALLGACAGATAQSYPTREIQVVVGLPAGSGGDVVARFYADKLSQLAGKPVIVENKPGMILSIGADAVAKAKPDGYTVLITSVTSSHAANLFNFKKLPYDPIKDFTPVATLQKSYFILMVRPEAPWQTVAELTAAMKAERRQGELRLRQPAGARLRRALQGARGPAGGRHPVPDLDGVAAGNVQRRARLPVHRRDAGHAAAPPASCAALAVTSGQRVPGVDIPTMAEAANIPEFDIAPVWGVLLPAGAPAPIVAQLEAWFGQIVKMDATKAFLANTHGAPFPGGAKELAAFLPKGNQEVGGAVEAREDRAAVTAVPPAQEEGGLDGSDPAGGNRRVGRKDHPAFQEGVSM